MPEPSPPTTTHTPYWRRNVRLIAALLAVWFVVTFVGMFFARELSFQLFNWPFSFWLAAQGAPVLYVGIIAVYARLMNRADRQAREAAKAAYNDT